MLVQMIAVHYANKSGRGQAATFVSIDCARDWVEAGLAVWSKGAKYINLTKTEAQMSRAAQSLTMGPRVTELAVMGSEFHRALVQAWCPLMKAA
jgi:hypothetical protein